MMVSTKGLAQTLPIRNQETTKMITLEELKERVAQNYDVCLICDELELEPEDILNMFGKKLWEKRDRFEEFYEV